MALHDDDKVTRPEEPEIDIREQLINCEGFYNVINDEDVDKFEMAIVDIVTGDLDDRLAACDLVKQIIERGLTA